MNHKPGISLLGIFVLLFALLACTISTPGVDVGTGIKGSGVVQTETRPVSNFRSVTLAGMGELQISLGQEESLQIEAEDNILPVIETRVEDGELFIGFRDGTGNIQPTKPIKYTLVVRELNGLLASGVGNIQLGALSTDDLDVQISGVGNIKIDSLEANLLSVLISGAGSSEVSGGEAGRLKLEITGAGSFRAPDLRVGTADITITGLGSARLWVTELLDVMLSGTGGVEYYGQPSVTQLITGLGTLKSLGDHP